MDRRLFLSTIVGALAATTFASSDAFAKAKKKKKKVAKKPTVKGPGVLIATRSVGIVTDADEITVPSSSGSGTELRVAISDKPIKFKSLVAVYSDGSTQSFNVAPSLGVGADTGWLKLATPKGQTLSSIKAVYTTGLTVTGTAHAAFFIR